MEKPFLYMNKNQSGGEQNMSKESAQMPYERTDRFGMGNRVEPTADRRRAGLPFPAMQTSSSPNRSQGFRFNYVTPNRTETEDDLGATWTGLNKMNSLEEQKTKL